MAVSGNWTLHYSWGPTNSYAATPITFNSDGTFVNGSTSGKWQQQDGTLLLTFNTGPARYAGNVEGNVAAGAMTTFAGANGSWYLTR